MNSRTQNTVSKDNVLMTAFLVMVLSISAIGGIDLAINAPVAMAQPVVYTA
jgi:hypothetical protein